MWLARTPLGKRPAPVRAGLMGLLALCALAAPLSAAPSSKCRLNMQSDYVSPADRTISDEKRIEVRLRVITDAIDDADIVFRGRLVSRQYLSDITRTFVPAILEIYDNAAVLKGAMPGTAKDGKVFLIREKLCNGGCPLNTLPEVVKDGDAREHVILAMNNSLPNPNEARDRWSDAVVYTGRIDALMGPCDPHQVNAKSVVALLAAPGEMDRLKRAYPPRTDDEKRKDFLEIQKKWARGR